MAAGAVDREFVYIFWAPGGLGGAAQGGGQRSGPGATEAIARRFFDFLRDVPYGMLGFEAISGQGRGGCGGSFHGRGSAEFPQNLANIPYGVAIFTELSSKTGL